MTPAEQTSLPREESLLLTSANARTLELAASMLKSGAVVGIVLPISTTGTTWRVVRIKEVSS